MDRWKELAGEAALGGTLGSVLSMAVLAWAGGRQTRTFAAPINATSQWLWGTSEAQAANQPDQRHTVTGYLVHHGAATFWAALHAAALGRRDVFCQPGPAMAAAAGTAALAAFVDLKLTPERFTPGFQHRVSRAALFATYAAFAVGLAVGSAVVRRRRRDALAERVRGQPPR